MLSVSDLPALNAFLNFTSAVLIATGYYFIRRRRIQAHRSCMVAAVIVSTAFLVSYLTYHYHAGSVPYAKHDWTRPLYYVILITHIILAVVIVPMVLRTVYLAYRRRFDKHARLARWTFPSWMYVSVTGVIVYLMLYQL